VLVSLATYNERGNLDALLDEVRGALPDAHILVVDDNSPDGTGRLADERAAKDPRLHVLHRAGKLGLGTAILTAMHYAIDHGFDYLVNMDADFSHHPRYLPAILAGMDRHDVMIGSRYVKGGGTEGWPLGRRVLSRCVNGLVGFLMRLPAHDCSGAYRCYRVAKLREARLDRVRSRGYSFQQEVLYRCRRAGCRLGEVPILFANRRAGQSKVNWYEAARSMTMLLAIGIPAFFGLDR
jgi:dolichol-phosphate mannosyltransferase